MRSETLLIRKASVLNGTGPADILVEAGRIAAIGHFCIGLSRRPHHIERCAALHVH